MSSTDNLERTPHARPKKIPVVPGGFDPVRAREFIGPLEDPLKPRPKPEMSARRMWAVAGAVALASSVSLVVAFAGRESESPACTLIAAGEAAQNIVNVQLDRPAGKEKVWVGNYTGVMEAHPAPGTAPDAANYTLDTAGYLHDELIGVYVGGVLCVNGVNLESVQPGDERFFTGKLH